MTTTNNCKNIIILRPEQSWGKRVQGEEVQPSGWQSPPLLPLFSHRGGTICDGDGDDGDDLVYEYDGGSHL